MNKGTAKKADGGEESGANKSLPVSESSQVAGWDRARLASYVRSIVGDGTTSRQVARMVSSRSGEDISHTTAAALLRGDRVSAKVLMAFSLAFSVPLNEVREAAGVAPLALRPWGESGDRVIHVADLATVLHDMDTERWEAMGEEQQLLALQIARQSLRGMLRGILPAVPKKEETACAA